MPLDAGYDFDEIVSAMKHCLFDEDFRQVCRDAENPYYMGGAGKKIAEHLATVPLDQAMLRKRMTLKGEIRDGWYR